jgi:DNA-nicking Smr family endonuclease
MDDAPLRLPIDGTLDLHAFAPADVTSVVDEYVREAHAAGFREVRLIHGRGRGVQRGLVQAALERHPLIEAFWDAPESHLGATVARLTGESRSQNSESRRRNAGC